MIILFGSYSRGNWVEDVYKENGTTYEYKSDYDILVVTEHHQDMPAGFADTRFKTVFPNQTDEEKRLFTLLVKAYIDSRYKMGYTIAREDLQWLATRVQKLKELTETLCKEQIERFTNPSN